MNLPAAQPPLAPSPNRQNRFNFISLFLTVSVLYLLLARASLYLVIQPEGIAAVWPPSGLALGLLLLDRRRAWKQILPAIFIANLIANLLGGNTLPVSLGFACANLFECGLLAWLLFRRLPFGANFERLRDTLIFCAYALTCAALTGLLGAAVPALAFGAPYAQTWLTWWVANSLGLILFTPLVLIWAARPNLRWLCRIEGLLLAALTLLAACLVFFNSYAWVSASPLGAYVLFVFFIWAALRFDQRMSTLLLVLVGLAALLGTLNGLGEFAYPSVSTGGRLLSAQVFNAVLAFASYVLSAVLAERRRAEERYKSQFKNLPLASFTWQRRGADFVMIDYNDAALAFTHGRISSMTGMTARSIYPQRPEVLEDLEQCFQSRALVRRGPRWNLISTGETRDLNISYEFVAPDLVVGHVEDISERLRAEQTLQRLAVIVEASDDAIISRDLDGIILTWNPGAERLYGYSAAQAIGQDIAILLPTEHPEDIAEVHARVSVGEYIRNIETVRRARDGRLLDVSLTISPILDDSGQVVGAASIARDISERKRFEEALRASEQHYRSLFENASLAIFQVTLHGRPLAVNPAFLRMFGYDSWEEFCALVNDSAQLFADPARRAEILRLRAADRQLNKFESTYQRKDGSTFTGELIMQVTLDAAGQPLYFEGIIQDISERKQFEQALRANEALYHAMFDATSAVKLLIEPDSGALVRANPSAAEFYGYTVEELQRMNINQLNTLPDEQIKIEMRAAAEESRTYFNFRHRLASGEVRDVEVYSGPLELDGRKLLHSIIHDVTVRKQAGRIQLARTRLLEFSQNHSLSELLTATLDETEALTASRIGFYHFMDAGQTSLQLQRWSTRTVQEYCTAAGAGSHYPISQAGVWADAVRQKAPVIHNDYNALPASQRQGLPAGHAALVRELVVPVLRGGRVVCILGVGNKQNDYNDEDVQAVAQMADLAWDIAERKQAELALRAARDELEQRVRERTSDLQAANASLEKALQARDEFLAAISHELRTPLSGVLGLTQVMQMQVYGPLTEKQAFALKNIESSGQRLLELINDILDFSQAQSGALGLDSRLCSLEEICRDCLKAVAGESAKKHQNASFRSSPAAIMIQGDARLIAKSVRHLLSNASKFTPEGGSFGIELCGEESAREISITVWDTGIGIRLEDLPRLFKPFVQLDARLQRQYNGTGLGLALVKLLVELHGGRVSVESDFGRGSRFIISLPWLE